MTCHIDIPYVVSYIYSQYDHNLFIIPHISVSTRQFSVTMILIWMICPFHVRLYNHYITPLQTINRRCRWLKSTQANALWYINFGPSLLYKSYISCLVHDKIVSVFLFYIYMIIKIAAISEQLICQCIHLRWWLHNLLQVVSN